MLKKDFGPFYAPCCPICATTIDDTHFLHIFRFIDKRENEKYFDKKQGKITLFFKILVYICYYIFNNK